MENGSLAFLTAGEGPSGWGCPWVQGPSEIATLLFGKRRGAPTFEALQLFAVESDLLEVPQVITHPQ